MFQHNLVVECQNIYLLFIAFQIYCNSFTLNPLYYYNAHFKVIVLVHQMLLKFPTLICAGDVAAMPQLRRIYPAVGRASLTSVSPLHAPSRTKIEARAWLHEASQWQF